MIINNYLNKPIYCMCVICQLSQVSEMTLSTQILFSLFAHISISFMFVRLVYFRSATHTPLNNVIRELKRQTFKKYYFQLPSPFTQRDDRGRGNTPRGGSSGRAYDQRTRMTMSQIYPYVRTHVCVRVCTQVNQ